MRGLRSRIPGSAREGPRHVDQAAVAEGDHGAAPGGFIAPARARTAAGVPAVGDHGLAVDEHPGNPAGIPVGLGEGRRVGDGRGVEDHDVGDGARLETAPVPETQLRRRQAGHLADRLGERQEAAVPDVVAQEARAGAVVPGMGLARRVRALGRAAFAVGADHDPGALEAERDVLLAHHEQDHVGVALRLAEDLDRRLGGRHAQSGGDTGEGLTLVLGPGGAPRDGDAVPAGVARDPGAVQRRADARAVGGIGQPRQERLASARVGPRGQEGAQTRAARRVRVHVGGHVEALRARRLDQLDRLGHLRPVRPARGLEMADLHRDGCSPPDLDRLGDRRQERVTLAPDVARVEAPALAGGPGQLDDLVGVGVHAGGVDQAGREPDGPLLHRAPHLGRHGPALVGGRAPVHWSHDQQAHRPVSHQRGDVDREPLTSQAVEVAPEGRPVPGEPRQGEGGGVDDVLAPVRGQRGRARPAVAHDLQREALVDLAVGGRQAGENEVGVRVHVDEPGRDHVTGRVDHPGRAGVGERLDGLDAVSRDGHVGPPRGPAGPVDHGPAPDQDVEHGASVRGLRPPQEWYVVRVARDTPFPRGLSAGREAPTGPIAIQSANEPRTDATD